MRSLWAVLLIVNIASERSTQAPAGPQSGLELGIQQVKDGHFDAALLTLDAVVRQFGNQPARRSDLVRAYVYLGAAYVGLQQESPARENFKQALKLDSSLQLDPNEFPPRVLRVFDATKKGKSKAALYKGGGIGALAVIGGAVLLLGSSTAAVTEVGETTTTTTTVTTTSTTTTTTTARGFASIPTAFSHEFVQDPTAAARSQVPRRRAGIEVLLNGLPIAAASGQSRIGWNVLEVLLDADGAPGTWRFTFHAGFRPGSIQVIAGQAIDITQESIAFRLGSRGRERVAFRFVADQ